MNPLKKFLIYTVLFSTVIYSIYYYFFKREIIYTQDICHIMDRRPFWNSELEDIEKEYNVSKFTILSFINQESSFRGNAKPPFKKLWGWLPTWNRISSSYGYSQAINGSWELFQKQTNNPNAYRGDFGDSAEFIAWYINKSNKMNNIDNYDTYNLYLSYHEGWGGYNNQSYLKKSSLLEISKKVEKIKNKYEVQFNQCWGLYEKLKEDIHSPSDCINLLRMKDIDFVRGFSTFLNTKLSRHDFRLEFSDVEADKLDIIEDITNHFFGEID